ncbi:hypothetical protein KIPB_010060, partial [Kipferlia bialata]
EHSLFKSITALRRDVHGMACVVRQQQSQAAGHRDSPSPSPSPPPEVDRLVSTSDPSKDPASGRDTHPGQVPRVPLSPPVHQMIQILDGRCVSVHRHIVAIMQALSTTRISSPMGLFVGDSCCVGKESQIMPNGEGDSGERERDMEREGGVEYGVSTVASSAQRGSKQTQVRECVIITPLCRQVLRACLTYWKGLVQALAAVLVECARVTGTGGAMCPRDQADAYQAKGMGRKGHPSAPASGSGPIRPLRWVKYRGTSLKQYPAQGDAPSQFWKQYSIAPLPPPSDEAPPGIPGISRTPSALRLCQPPRLVYREFMPPLYEGGDCGCQVCTNARQIASDDVPRSPPRGTPTHDSGVSLEIPTRSLSHVASLPHTEPLSDAALAGMPVTLGTMSVMRQEGSHTPNRHRLSVDSRAGLYREDADSKYGNGQRRRSVAVTSLSKEPYLETDMQLNQGSHTMSPPMQHMGHHSMSHMSLRHHGQIPPHGMGMHQHQHQHVDYQHSRQRSQDSQMRRRDTPDMGQEREWGTGPDPFQHQPVFNPQGFAHPQGHPKARQGEEMRRATVSGPNEMSAWGMGLSMSPADLSGDAFGSVYSPFGQRGEEWIPQ